MWRLGLIFLGLISTALPAAEVPVVVYHDIVPGTPGDAYAVRESDFREQMNFLRRAGYRPIRLADYVRAASEGAVLPDKPVLLTFDDGLASFKDIVLPVLTEYGFPAVVSITTGWLDGRDVPDSYRGRLLTAEALRAVSRSPLVEVLSHTDQLHEGIPADPFGSLGPAAITRRYLGEGRYESESAYRARVRADLRRSRQRLAEITGKPPAGIAWPYGHHNTILIEEAAALGMSAHLVLDEVPADTRQYPRINRRLLYKTRSLASFEQALQMTRRDLPVRLLEFRLDEMARATRQDQIRQLRQLIERVRLIRANTVIVSPFTRDGQASFYANSGMPVHSDILHRVLHQLRTSAGVGTILLRLPANVENRETYHELARRHPYDGILVSGMPTDASVDWLRKTFGFHRPGLRCGTDQSTTSAACRDFQVLKIQDTVVDVQSVARQARIDRPVYVLVENDDLQPLDRLPRMLRALRQAGLRHYGIVEGAYLQNTGLLQKVAMELVQPSGGDTR